MHGPEDGAMREELEELRDRLAGAELENGQLRDRLAELEQQCTGLATLCAATRRLHTAGSGEAALQSVVEIVVNLLGCEDFAILWQGPRGATSVAARQGGEERDWVALARGHGPVGKALREGARFVAESPREPSRDVDGQPVAACIPLSREGSVQGALVLARMLPQKKDFGRLDRGLFDLLAQDAAGALDGAVPAVGDGEP